METVKPQIKPLSLLTAFGLSVGAAIGWGSFVMTSSDYLNQAGPVGSIIGLVIGALIMVVVAYDYSAMMKRYPDNGGLYSFIKNAFGHEHAFFASWFLILVYAAILWANVSSVGLFARTFFGETFKFGFHYQVFGYDVYFGEILISLAALLLFGAFTLWRRKVLSFLNTIMALSFLGIILFVVVYVTFAHSWGPSSFEPAFVPGGGEFKQIVAIIAMSPWAFIGFESISHMSERFESKMGKIFRTFVIAIIAITLVYILLCYVSILAFPESDLVHTWHDYISNRGEYSGFASIPPFFVAQYYLGDAGTILFGIALFCILGTSLIGTILATSNLIQRMASDGVFPRFMAKRNRYGAPYMAILFLLGSSFIVLFIGKAAVGWIVDVSTIITIIAYTYVAACTLHFARKRRAAKDTAISIIGIAIGVIFALYVFIKNMLGQYSMARESFLAFSIWGMVGLIYYFFLLKKDERGDYGHSTIVLVGSIFLVLFSTYMWYLQTVADANNTMTIGVQELIEKGELINNATLTPLQNNTTSIIVRCSYVVLGIFLSTQLLMIFTFRLSAKRTHAHKKKLNIAEDMVNCDSLTGVKSKHAFMTYEHAFNDEIHKTERKPFAIVVCDVNDLKTINDRFGHDAGDAHIQKACTIICNAFKHSPVFRVGGDEFVVILEGEDYAHRQELYDAVYSIVEKNSHCEEIVISFGLAIYQPEKDHSVTDVFRRADEMMYEVKARLKANRPEGYSIR